MTGDGLHWRRPSGGGRGTAIVTAVLTAPEQQRRTETAERHRAATSERGGDTGITKQHFLGCPRDSDSVDHRPLSALRPVSDTPGLRKTGRQTTMLRSPRTTELLVIKLQYYVQLNEDDDPALYRERLPSVSTSLTAGGAPVLLAPPAVAVLPALIITRRWRAFWFSTACGSTCRTRWRARRCRWRHRGWRATSSSWRRPGGAHRCHRWQHRRPQGSTGRQCAYFEPVDFCFISLIQNSVALQ
ncbi:uncharacterized protein LOC122372709 isoform X1 [Amphibalanus amphitrite]|uniref:uncharacterized protein LOC122372709 isoform X1 n=1 Tax=Amphibalanus amphitrite TaxID=1232801 RepID=UPI001C9136CF|nr:uncharacterized protein LOC122372709 isoform X1 [Amphibalanus amphitrite]